ncbi:MAG TPA: hypothetical protein VFY84_19545 [Jiangellales bacterium]|nr:hypothetical protein [Jiangellales bacterium]
MRPQLRDSYLWHCGKRMVIDPIDDEGQARVTHRCTYCTYSTRAPGERPQKTDSPYMAEIRQRMWEVTDA